MEEINKEVSNSTKEKPEIISLSNEERVFLQKKRYGKTSKKRRRELVIERISKISAM